MMRWLDGITVSMDMSLCLAAQTKRWAEGIRVPGPLAYAGGELQGSPVWQALAGHKRRIPLAVVPRAVPCSSGEL